jgi:hypothetical protein
MSHTSSGKWKGKSASLETGWSAWEWNTAGRYWACCRTKASGEVEYKYEYSNQANAVSQAQIPRANVDTSYPSVSTEDQGTSTESANDYSPDYKHSGSPSAETGPSNSATATGSQSFPGFYNCDSLSGSVSYSGSPSNYASPGSQVSYPRATVDTTTQEFENLRLNPNSITEPIYEDQSTCEYTY